jgi:hypothetical protein
VLATHVYAFAVAYLAEPLLPIPKPSLARLKSLEPLDFISLPFLGDFCKQGNGNLFAMPIQTLQ